MEDITIERTCPEEAKIKINYVFVVLYEQAQQVKDEIQAVIDKNRI